MVLDRRCGGAVPLVWHFVVLQFCRRMVSEENIVSKDDNISWLEILWVVLAFAAIVFIQCKPQGASIFDVIPGPRWCAWSVLIVFVYATWKAMGIR